MEIRIIALIVLIGMVWVSIAGYAAMKLLMWAKKSKSEDRGFEVKLSTGEVPETEKKEEPR